MSDIRESRVSAILASPFDHEWTIQGFGMLRTYLYPDEIHRLHIWDAGTAVPEVSVIHNHPWDFDSRIYRGFVTNQRYALGPLGERVRVARIRTGEGGGLIGGKAERGRLHHFEPEYLGPGEAYHMDAPEMHESIPSRGAVTVISRKFYTARDDQVATVCWRTGEWVSAEPRPATRAEIEHFVDLALASPPTEGGAE